MEGNRKRKMKKSYLVEKKRKIREKRKKERKEI